jgi:hypothetical protein
MTIMALKVALLSGAYADKPWEGVIEVRSSSLLEELHFGIQDALGFDDDHLYEFFIARTERSRDRVRFDDDNGQIYERTIETLYPLPEGRNLYYLFDYGDHWLFRISRMRGAMPGDDPKATYPRLVRESGDKPAQYPPLDE